MKLQKLLSLTRQAIDEYGMIQENDKIAVGISGGKDSLTLLYALSCLRKFYPHKFDIVAVTVDLGFDNLNLDGIRKFCKERDVEYHVIKTQIAEVVFITVIRPLLFLYEGNVKGFVKEYQLPVVKSPCPVDGSTKREDVKNLIGEINHQYPGAKARMIRAVLDDVVNVDKIHERKEQ